MPANQSRTLLKRTDAIPVYTSKQEILDNKIVLDYKGHMAHSKPNVRPLNLRDFPEDLYWQCKEMAARRRVSTKRYVIEALQEAIKRDSKTTKPT